MTERMFGLETEYAFACLGARGAQASSDGALGRFWDLAGRKLPHLPGLYSSGMFLQNGARFYIDCGSHPELTTPECLNPWDAVRYTEAGERILAGLAEDLTAAEPGAGQALFFKANVDYSGTGSTWGCHESYLHTAAPQTVPPLILPFLVSRILYAGAGGFVPTGQGLVFTLSPRAWHLTCAVSGESTHGRGIFHTKDESLSGAGYHRLHLLCGESLCSQTASWLRIAATALVLALIEAGRCPCESVDLRDPLEALRTFAADPECKAAVPAANGGSRTALGIQRAYLAAAEAHCRDAFMPSWASQACALWRSTLDRIEAGPPAVASRLDWAIKGALFEKHAVRRGVPMETWPAWTHIVQEISAAIEHTEFHGKSVPVDTILAPGSAFAADIERLTPYVRGHGLSWDGFNAFLVLREQLFEIDWRFGQIGDRGIFRSLDGAGALDHRVPGVDNIEHAMAHPPAAGRAHLRGTCVQRFAGRAEGAAAVDWTSVEDVEHRRMLDLSDPFTTKEDWRDLPEGASASLGMETRLRDILAGYRGRLSVTPDGFRVGDHVVLGRHEPIEGDANWNSAMETYVGQPATITRISRPDHSGSWTVQVDLDQGRYAWRTRNMQRASS